MGAKGRQKVAALNDPERIAREHLDFYREILHG